jgi:hypothetical protein
VYGNVLRALKDNTDGTRPVPISHAGFAGSVSGIINCLASCPIELVKTRLQMQIGMASCPVRWGMGWVPGGSHTRIKAQPSFHPSELLSGCVPDEH